MIYGEQRRHFPKRNEDLDRKTAIQEQIKMEIAKTKREIITDEDYQKLITGKPQRILIFMADEQNISTLNMLSSLQRFL